MSSSKGGMVIDICLQNLKRRLLTISTSPRPPGDLTDAVPASKVDLLCLPLFCNEGICIYVFRPRAHLTLPATAAEFGHLIGAPGQGSGNSFINQNPSRHRKRGKNNAVFQRMGDGCPDRNIEHREHRAVGSQGRR